MYVWTRTALRRCWRGGGTWNSRGAKEASSSLFLLRSSHSRLGRPARALAGIRLILLSGHTKKRNTVRIGYGKGSHFYQSIEQHYT